jgi:threonine aldolase
MSVIDLRSGTVTRSSRGMRRAMAEAEVVAAARIVEGLW